MRTGLHPDVFADAARTYEVDGVVCLHQVLDATWIERLRDLAQEMLSASVRHPEQSQELTKEGDDGRFYNEMFIWPRHEGFRQVLFQSPLAAIVGRLMEVEKVNVLFDQLLIKEPGTLEPTPWHHDFPFWPFQGTRVCTLWLALDEVTIESGSVAYIKGSHRWGRQFQPTSFVGDGRYQQDKLEQLPDLDAMRDELDFIHFDLEPGDCTVHHGLTLHGAPGNAHAERRRRAYVTRWGGDGVTYDPRDGTQPMLHDPGINSGDELDCELWPVVWRRGV